MGLTWHLSRVAGMLGPGTRKCFVTISVIHGRTDVQVLPSRNLGLTAQLRAGDG